MSYSGLIGELRNAREQVSALVETLDDSTCRSQYHPDLSPIGWHLGHCTWTESFWLQATVAGNEQYTRPLQALYTPTETARDERGRQLPHKDVLLKWSAGLQSINDDLLESAPPRIRTHALMQDNYLLHFLVQHYSQHYESMHMVLAQRAIQSDTGAHGVETRLTAHVPDTTAIPVQPGQYHVGGTAPVAYDNELPVKQLTLDRFCIAPRAVTNGEYLAFMQDGGYRRSELWSKPGWSLQLQSGYAHPDHWQINGDGDWYGIADSGPCSLPANDPVSGIGYFEAEAYARWAGGRLPHEHQWEVACGLQLLEDTGCAWEWCSNTFYPYAGFRPFPYKNYSQAWFDGNHYSLRGGSLHTRPPIRRASFRNFYTPDKRYIFAGLRLAYES